MRRPDDAGHDAANLRLPDKMHSNIFVGIGANLSEPKQQVLDALVSLNHHAKIELRDVSSLYQSAPMGPADQPDYINAVAHLTTTLRAHALLDVLQQIEQQQGRVRNGKRWGPRTLDLDILLFDNQEYDDPRLTVPHYGMQERAFVLYPMAEIAPSLLMPDGQDIGQWLEKCARGSLEVAMMRDAVIQLIWQSV